MAESSSNANGTAPTGLGSNGINTMAELLEKQLQILKSFQIPSIERSPTQLARKTKMHFSEKPIFEILKDIMQSLESNHKENYVGVISPIEFARINFIEWITEIRLVECHLPSLSYTAMAYYAGRVPFSSCGRPEISLDQSTYNFRDLKDKQLMHELASALLRHWPANSVPVLDPSESGYWDAKKCIDQDTEKQLGTLLDTSSSYIDGHCVLPINRAESLACLLANRDRRKSILESSIFFLGRYCGPWQSSISHNTKRETRYRVNELEGRVHVELRLQLYMRAFTLNKADKLSRKDASIDGIICDRLAVSTKIPVAAEDVSWGVMERRWAYDIRCPVPVPENDEMGFVVLRMVDYNLFLEEEGEQEMNSDLNSDSRWAGILVFQKLLFEGCVEWEGEWRGLLKDLDLFIGFNVNDMSDKQLRHQLMYDDRKLSRSESYFLILQLLRVFEDWIKTTNHEITQIAEECEQEISNLGFPDHDVSANWEIICSAQRKRTQSLLTHIGKKTEEIERLRSGLYNALSVREATRSTRMNQIMLLFTLATILYLPPTFVATFMALDLFQATDQTHFWYVFGGAIGVTYLAAIVALSAIYRGDIMDTIVIAKKWFTMKRTTKEKAGDSQTEPSRDTQAPLFSGLRKRFHKGRSNEKRV